MEKDNIDIAIEELKAIRSPEEDEKARCTFCDLPKSSIRFMVASPGSAFICNECIEACMEMWKDFQAEEKKVADYVTKQRLAENITE